ncbi:MAG: hypothetical protein ACI8ZM_005198 [Crocinitomix sp.]|jgi:hypothetical protein
MEWTLKAFGVLLIGIILLAIVIAFIFSAKFRKDVIAGEGEAAVLGLINVKGVIIVLLTGIFGGIFVYLIVTDTSPVVNQNFTVQNAITKIKTDQTENSELSLIKTGDNVEVRVGETTLGTAQIAQEKLTLAVTKRRTKLPVWDILKNDNAVQGLRIGTTFSYRIFGANATNILDSINHGGVTHHGHSGKSLNFSEAYRAGNSSTLFFRIDGVDQSGVSKYTINFAEYNEQRDSLVWKVFPDNGLEKNLFYKTGSGKIHESEQFKLLQWKDWDKIYFVAVGIGNPGNHGGKMDHVDLANIMVFDIQLETTD